MQGQFEQQLNGYQLRKLGYGTSVDEVTSMAIGDFLYRLPDFEARLSQYAAGDNSQIKAKLDALLADDAARAPVSCGSTITDRVVKLLDITPPAPLGGRAAWPVRERPSD